jgi:nitric oxide reductase subunit C
MLSRAQARTFFIGGTVLSFAVFIWLTIDSFQKIPAQTNQDRMDAQVIRGKHLWDEHNCMGCHTLLGEGGYYAPELTKVYERRGPGFIRAMLEDPQAMYPGQRKMYQYDLTDEEIEDFIAFFRWIGEMDLNGFPPKPVLFGMATPGGEPLADKQDRPKVYNQMCLACHAISGQGGAVGPALDGIGDRMTMAEVETWLKDPAAVRPGTTMPQLPLSEEDIRELAAFLTTLSDGPGADEADADEADAEEADADEAETDEEGAEEALDDGPAEEASPIDDTDAAEELLR